MRLSFHIVQQGRTWLLRVSRTEGASVRVEERETETLEGACGEALLIAKGECIGAET